MYSLWPNEGPLRGKVALEEGSSMTLRRWTRLRVQNADHDLGGSDSLPDGL